jgi:tRNA G18 (ribose-2'-O)-methylase SpoU
MRGYFGIGAEGISKALNLGNLLRTAHAFGASFAFTIEAETKARLVRHADTAASEGQVPFYPFERFADFRLPKGCELVGVEFTEDAIPMPSFRHPARAAYIFGSERGSLSPEVQAVCRHIVKIPTAFCLNVATAGAIVMYDRLLTMGRFAERPTAAGGPREPFVPKQGHEWGLPLLRDPKPGGRGFLKSPKT